MIINPKVITCKAESNKQSQMRLNQSNIALILKIWFMLPCILKYELKTLPIIFRLLPFLRFPSLEIRTNQSLWFDDCFWKLQEVKVTDLKIFCILPSKLKRKKIRVHSENNSLSCTTYTFYSQGSVINCDSAWKC